MESSTAQEHQLDSAPTRNLAPPSAVWTPAGRRTASAQLRSDELLASSPILNNTTPINHVNQSSVTPASRDSSVRLSRNLDDLRWDGSSIRDNDSIFRQSLNQETSREPETPSKNNDIDTDTDAQSDAGDSVNAYSVLSKRADFILENAKRKLNLLEGNLGRARHSLLIPPSGSFDYRSTSPASPHSTPSDDGTPSTRLPLHRINFAPPRDGSKYPPSQRVTSSGHSRVFSDTSVPFNGGTSIKGSRSLDHVNRDLPLRRALDRRSIERHSPELGRDSPMLDTVVEDENAISSHRRGESASAKELRAQAEELRNRISFLQQRSKTDSDRRRSLRLERGMSRDFADQVAALKDSLDEQEKVIDELEASERTTELEKDPRAEWHQVLEQNEASDGDDDSYSDESSGYSSSVADEYEMAAEDLEIPEEDEAMEGAHEDRIDAFDYEHFILHSIMGTHARRDSEASASSEETPAPAPPEQDDQFTENAVNDTHVAMNEKKVRAQQSQDSEIEDDGAVEEKSWPIPPSNTRPGVVNGQTVRSGADAASKTATLAPPPKKTMAELAREKLAEAQRRPASLIVSALTRPDSSLSQRARTPAALKEEDKALMYSCAESFRTVCMKLQRNDLGPHDGTDLRQRLEIAKRVLNGDL